MCNIQTCVSASILKCDFDSYPCDWNNDDSNKHVWKKQNGEPRDYHTGPSTDHSTASGKHMVFLSHFIVSEISSTDL